MLTLFGTNSQANAKEKVFFMMGPKHSTEGSVLIKQIERELSDSRIIEVVQDVSYSDYLLYIWIVLLENLNGEKINYLIKSEVLHRAIAIPVKKVNFIGSNIISGKNWDESIKGIEPKVIIESVYEQPNYRTGPYERLDYNSSAKLLASEFEIIIKNHSEECDFN